MSKSHIKQEVWKIPMPIFQGYHVITSRTIDKRRRELIIMTSITKEEEDLLDNAKNLKLHRGNLIFNISPRDIICYGAIDFTDNSEDLDKLEDMKFLNHLDKLGIIVPSNYDYENHVAYSDSKHCKYYDTTNPAIVTQYIHGCLGKPERCCIFRRKVNA